MVLDICENIFMIIFLTCQADLQHLVVDDNYKKYPYVHGLEYTSQANTLINKYFFFQGRFKFNKI